MKKPLVSEMTLREKIGQCLLPAQWDIYRKYEESYDVLRPREEQIAMLQKEQFGTFYGEQVGIYYEEAAAQGVTIDLAEKQAVTVKAAEYKEFLDTQRKVQKIPALATVDCEHGAGSIFSDGNYICESPNIGAADSEELAFQLGACIARELRCGGINWRWFPVVDIANRFNMCIMRSFAGDDPDRMIRMANANIRGMQSEGVAATVKHFPGGDRYEHRDSHFTKTLISLSKEEWWEEQGRIFQEVINDGVYSVMVGHTAFPAVDDTKINGNYIPSTLSKKVITDLLKGEMGFDGVVITDGLGMASVNTLMDYEDLLVYLMNAGNDVLLGSQICAGDLIEKAVKDGRIPESRIDDACTRVLNMKEKLGMFEDNYYDLPYTMKEVAEETRRVDMEVARKSITLVRDREQMLPLKKEKIKNVTVICSSHYDRYFEELQVLQKELEARGATVHMQRRVKSKEEMKAIADRSDLIIFAVYVASHRPMGGMTLYGEECFTYLHACTYGREKSIGVSMGYPYIHYDIMENADTFLNTYGKSPACMKAFVESIYGEIPIVGKSPVLLTPKLYYR